MNSSYSALCCDTVMNILPAGHYTYTCTSYCGRCDVCFFLKESGYCRYTRFQLRHDIDANTFVITNTLFLAPTSIHQFCENDYSRNSTSLGRTDNCLSVNCGVGLDPIKTKTGLLLIIDNFVLIKERILNYWVTAKIEIEFIPLLFIIFLSLIYPPPLPLLV
jgi:hypothetical protein